MVDQRQGRQMAEEQVVVFLLGKEQYGIDIALVQEIKTMAPITQLPEAPEHIDGMFDFRGRITPVVNVRSRLGMARTEVTQDTRIIVVSFLGQPVGLLVDGVSEVLRVPAELIAPPPPLLCDSRQSCVRGIARLNDDRLIILLDLEWVLNPSVEVLSKAA